MRGYRAIDWKIATLILIAIVVMCLAVMAYGDECEAHGVWEDESTLCGECMMQENANITYKGGENVVMIPVEMPSNIEDYSWGQGIIPEDDYTTTRQLVLDNVDEFVYDGKTFMDFGDLIAYTVIKQITENQVDILDLLNMMQAAYDEE